MDQVHDLLKLADGHFQRWQKAVAARTERYHELQAAAAQNEPEHIIQLKRKVTEEEVEATVNVRMLQHCVHAAEYVAAKDAVGHKRILVA